MNPTHIIEHYYEPGSELHRILMLHSQAVADHALEAADRHPELQFDLDFVREAALLHDIGICLCDAPRIQCFGTEPYIRHGVLGAELLRREGLPRHARVCERHTGTGLTREQIEAQSLPLPPCDLIPVTLEEQLICWADKFYSKTRLDHRKTADEARRSLERFGHEGIAKFDAWCTLFG